MYDEETETWKTLELVGAVQLILGYFGRYDANQNLQFLKASSLKWMIFLDATGKIFVFKETS